MNEIVDFIAKHKVVVICRGLYGEDLVKTIKALYDGGVRVVEVTFDQADTDAIEKTCGAIKTIKEHFPEMKVGSGTVTCVEHVKATKAARWRVLPITGCQHRGYSGNKTSRAGIHTRRHDFNRNPAGTSCGSGYRENFSCRLAWFKLYKGCARADQSCEVSCGSRCE